MRSIMVKGPVLLVPDPDKWEAEEAMRPTPANHPVHGSRLAIGGDVPDWPEHWQRANGVDPDDLHPHGATHTVAEVLDSPPEKEIHATIAARVLGWSSGGSPIRVWVDDGTGRLTINVPGPTPVLGPAHGEWNEFDIILPAGSGARLPRRAYRRRDNTDEATLPGEPPTATGTAVRRMPAPQ